MRLTCELKKRFLHKDEVTLVINGATAVTLTSGDVTELSLPACERYYLTLATDKPYDGVTVLICESDAVRLTVTRQKKSFALDTEGARIEVLPLGRLLTAMCDEGQILNLTEWERDALFGLYYLDLNHRDAILESVHLLEIRDALLSLGLPELSERLSCAIASCELPLPLDPMKKLTPEEQTALVEGYHILWSREEGAPDGEEARVLVRIYDYIWEKQRDGA